MKLSAFFKKRSGRKKGYQKIVMFREPAVEGEALSADYQALLSEYRASWVEPLPLINGALCFFDRHTEFQALAERDEIISLEDDLKVRLRPVPVKSKSLIFDDPRRQIITWGIQRIGADKAWRTSRGEGVKAAVLDTGVDFNHPDLKGNLKGGINLVNPRISPGDDNGHGTHVAGIIAAVDNDFGVLGTSPRVGLYAVKVLDAHGEGYFSNIIKGLDWCVRSGIQVINLSFGADQPSQALHEAVRRVASAGRIIVAAAGNDGTYQSVDYPAAYPETISVGSIDEYDRLSPFSSRGPEIKLVAPGSYILSTGLKGFYKRMSGTSMAAPHVAGAVAIIKSKVPQTAHDGMLQILQSSAEKLTFLSNEEQGAGLVRVDNAVAGLKTAV